VEVKDFLKHLKKSPLKEPDLKSLKLDVSTMIREGATKAPSVLFNIATLSVNISAKMVLVIIMKNAP
jgi:hypothetical protein